MQITCESSIVLPTHAALMEGGSPGLFWIRTTGKPEKHFETLEEIAKLFLDVAQRGRQQTGIEKSAQDH